MTKFSFINLLLSFITLSSWAQENICEKIQNEFQQAINQSNFTEAEYQYLKKLNLCEASLFDMGQLSEVMDRKGYSYQWMQDKSFVISSFYDPNIDFNVYKQTMRFEDLDAKHPIKNKYQSEIDLLKGLKLDIDDLKDHTYFIPNKNLFVVRHWNGNIIYNDDFSILYDSRSTGKSLEYVGNNLFVSNYADSTSIYLLEINQNKKKLKNIISKQGSAYVYASKTDESIITIENYFSNNNNIQIYDGKGKLLLDNISIMELNPISRLFIIDNLDKKKLYNYEMEMIVDNAYFVETFWKNDKPYILVKYDDHSYHLLDNSGKSIHANYPYDEMYHHSNGYAIAIKDSKYGLIDLVTNKLIIPLGQDYLKYFAKGIFCYQKDNIWQLVDEKNRKINTLNYANVSLLYESYIPYLLIEDGNGNKGLTNLSGTLTHPLQYSDIKYNPLNQSIELRKSDGTLETLKMN